jgi:two-component system response regulator LytT
MKSFFFIRYAGRYQKVSFADILFIEACKNYCRIVMHNRAYMILITLKKLEELLPAKEFCRVHRSYLISMDKLMAFDHERAELPGHTIPIGEQFRHVLPRCVLILQREVKLPEVPFVSSMCQFSRASSAHP